MLRKQPYFMENKDWYYESHDNKDSPWLTTCHLTELGKSIPEVVKSFNEHQQAKKKNYDPVLYYEAMQLAEKSLREDYKKQGLNDEEIEAKIKEWRNK